MTEYKDVELLKNQIADFKRAVNAVKPMNSDYLTGYISALSVIEGVIAEQPIADVAKVVRCKDCVHFRTKPNYCGKLAVDDVEEDFYCCYGERRAEKYIKASDCEKYFYEHLDDLHMAGAMNAIDEMPNADVIAVKHGRWINENFYTRCSVCGNMAIYDKYGQEVESDYCPRCGAKLC